MTYTTVLIDDEPLALEVLQHYLNSFPSFEIVASLSDAQEAFVYLKEHPVDLVFTDIAMPHISGMELVKLNQHATQFVITTSYTDYAVESFELNVVDYLLKPISFERFNTCVERFKQSKQNTTQNTDNQAFYVREGDEFVQVKLPNIDYIEGKKDYAKIVCQNSHYMALRTLKSIEEKIACYGFVRVHKSFIIPLRKASQFNGRCVLVGEHEIPVGATYRKMLKNYFEQKSL